MPYYPKINEIPCTRDLTDVFGGYNRRTVIGDGEFSDMQNLTSSRFPALSPRPKRGVYATPAAPKALLSKGRVCYIDGENLILNGSAVPLGLSLRADAGRSELISMGARIIVITREADGDVLDMKYVNTVNPADRGDLCAEVTTATDTEFSLCVPGEGDYASLDTDVIYKSAAPPAAPNNLDWWLDISAAPHALKRYSSASGVWVTVPTVYVKISATGIGADFAEGDGVTISGITAPALESLNGSAVIRGRGADYIVITGVIDAAAVQSGGGVKVGRKPPLTDFVTEAGNRLWGCRCGLSREGSTVNEIYASKLGDPFNWSCFSGISTDSWAASVGSDGVFTGAATHLGYPLFFKENVLHKVYISASGAHRIVECACRGVQKGCAKSLCTVGETLYYKSRTGVCAYDGSLPSEVSEALGGIAYSDAAAGALGDKYYISMKDGGDAWHMFVCDTKRGMWHREDNTRALGFCAAEGELYFIDGADNRIRTVCGSGVTDTAPVEWYSVTGPISATQPECGYVTRLGVRMSLEPGTYVSFFAEYDSSGEWEQISALTGTSRRCFTLPLRPRRCDRVRIKIVGVGDARIFAVSRTAERGSGV